MYSLFIVENLRLIALHMCLKILVSENCCFDWYAICILEPYHKQQQQQKNRIRNCFQNILNSKAGLANGPFLESTILIQKYS